MRNRLKKPILFLLTALLAGLLCGFGIEAEENDKPVDVVLITDYGTSYDNSYKQGAWDGGKEYAE